MRIIALSLSSFLLAHLANSEPPGALARSLAASFLRGTDSASPARPIDHTAFDPYFVELSRPPSLEVVSLPTAGLFASPGTIGPEGLAGSTASGAFREPVDERLFAVRRMAGDLNSTEQMLAAFGLRRFSFRVSSWRRLGPGPSVHAGTFSVVRNLSLHSGRLNIGLGRLDDDVPARRALRTPLSQASGLDPRHLPHPTRRSRRPHAALVRFLRPPRPSIPEGGEPCSGPSGFSKDLSCFQNGARGAAVSSSPGQGLRLSSASGSAAQPLR